MKQNHYYSLNFPFIRIVILEGINYSKHFFHLEGKQLNSEEKKLVSIKKKKKNVKYFL